MSYSQKTTFQFFPYLCVKRALNHPTRNKTPKYGFLATFWVAPSQPTKFQPNRWLAGNTTPWSPWPYQKTPLKYRKRLIGCQPMPYDYTVSISGTKDWMRGKWLAREFFLRIPPWFEYCLCEIRLAASADQGAEIKDLRYGWIISRNKLDHSKISSNVNF